MENQSVSLDFWQDTPLVLLPGTLCDTRVFQPLLERLPALHTIAADMHGADSTGDIARRLLATLPPRFALLGFSLGAIVALEIAARAPERVCGMGLISGTARDVPPETREQRRRAARLAGPAGEHVATVLWPSYVAPDRLADGDLRALILEMAESSPPDALIRQTEVALSRVDSRGRLGDIAVPSLVLAGEEDAVSPPAVQREMASLLPNATLTLVPRAGHFALIEHPDACARAVAGWLGRISTPHGQPVSRAGKGEQPR